MNVRRSAEAVFPARVGPPLRREDRLPRAHLALADERFKGLLFPDFVEIVEPEDIPDALRNDPHLDPGETAAIALALERSISTILIDDAAGRSAAAALGLRPLGLLAVLIEGKKQGLVAEVLPLLRRLKSEARFYIDAPLLSRVAILSGEDPST